MTTFTVRTDCGTEQSFDSRRAAESGRETHVSLCDECGDDDVRIEMGDAGGASAGQTQLHRQRTDGRGAAVEQGAAESADATSADAAPGDADRPDPAADLPDEMRSVRTDPLDVVPGYMIAEVEGQPTINKRGYAVIANHFDIVVNAEPITTAGETDHEYAEFRARAWHKDDGPEHAYTGHGTARATEDRRGIADNLNEMAETRAMKRAVAWASGVGILAWEEMAGYVEE
jgi:hypothetical protein